MSANNQMIYSITDKKKPAEISGLSIECGGEIEILTLGGLQTLAGFQDQCIQPLCHPSRTKRILNIFTQKAKLF